MTELARETRWTKGPWKFEDHNYIGGECIYLPGDIHFATIFRAVGTDAKANAYLIAAAPEMYEELERAAGMIASPESFDREVVLGQIRADSRGDGAGTTTNLSLCAGIVTIRYEAIKDGTICAGSR